MRHETRTFIKVLRIILVDRLLLSQRLLLRYFLSHFIFLLYGCYKLANFTSHVFTKALKIMKKSALWNIWPFPAFLWWYFFIVSFYFLNGNVAMYIIIQILSKNILQPYFLLLFQQVMFFKENSRQCDWKTILWQIEKYCISLWLIWNIFCD